MSKARKTRKSRKSVSVAPTPFNGDHGTGTRAAMAGTVVEEITNEKGENPNHIGRRRRILQSDVWEEKLSMRQLQAAQAIERAYARVDALGSGGDSIGRMLDLRTSVDASPKPDATIDVQTSARSHLVHVMRGVPGAARPVIEHLFWYGMEIELMGDEFDVAMNTSLAKVALDLVANRGVR